MLKLMGKKLHVLTILHSKIVFTKTYDKDTNDSCCSLNYIPSRLISSLTLYILEIPKQVLWQTVKA